MQAIRIARRSRPATGLSRSFQFGKACDSGGDPAIRNQGLNALHLELRSSARMACRDDGRKGRKADAPAGFFHSPIVSQHVSNAFVRVLTVRQFNTSKVAKMQLEEATDGHLVSFNNSGQLDTPPISVTSASQAAPAADLFARARGIGELIPWIPISPRHLKSIMQVSCRTGPPVRTACLKCSISPWHAACATT